MAARLNARHHETIRQKIQADRIVAWLQAGIFGTQYQKKNVELSAEKVSAAKALLNKCLPDLTRTEVSGKDGKAIEVTEVVRKVV